MSVMLIGLNHRSAPLDVRERLAFTREGMATALILFKRQFPSAEAAILSTCNRVELLLDAGEDELTTGDVVRFLSQARDVPAEEFESHLYQLEGSNAIRQLFRVVSGLDSMVVGEYQIVNQLKQAYQIAHEQNTAGPTLHRLFHHAFGVSKRIRSETTVADGKMSIPSVALDVIREAEPDFVDKRILIVGAGEMAQLTAQHLRDANARRFAVTTRTLTNAKALAEVCHGEAVPFDQLDGQLVRADIVVTATNCPTAILSVERMSRCQELRGHRPLLLVDLAVPRNIAAEVRELHGIQLHDVDSLGRIVAENRRQRQSQLGMCEQIILEETTAFEQWLSQSSIRPLIEQMYEDVRSLAEIELRSTFNRCPDFSENQRQAVAQFMERLVNKLMHPCVCTVREEGRAVSASSLAAAFHKTRTCSDARQPPPRTSGMKRRSNHATGAALCGAGSAEA